MGIFTKRLSELMSERGINQVALSKATNIPQPHISKYIRGREPRGENILKIAQYFEVSVDYLIGKTEEMKLGKETQSHARNDACMEGKEDYAIRKDLYGKVKKSDCLNQTEALREIRDVFLLLADRLDKIINFSQKNPPG